MLGMDATEQSQGMSQEISQGMSQGMSMEMNTLPLEQSMTISDVDWKNDLYNVIAEDEKQFTALSEEDTEFEDPKALYEQSWGVYFAERSGAMGDLSGTSTFRPQFSPPNPFTRQIRSMPQTPPDRLSISFLNRSQSAPPTLPSKMKKSLYNARLNRWQLQSDDTMDLDMEVDTEEVAKLSLEDLMLEDLMSPNQNNRNATYVSLNFDPEINTLSPIDAADTDDDRKTNSVCVSNLLPQFEDCSLDDFENGNSTELNDAIHSAIERRRSFEPDLVINRSHINTSNIQRLPTTVCDNDITRLEMRHIKQYHNFIQFYINPRRMNAQNIDDINQECCALLDRYVSMFQDMHCDDQTSWFNRNTNQCTFHLLMSGSNEANNNETKKWKQLFLSIFEAYPWIQSNKNEIIFSQLAPQ